MKKRQALILIALCMLGAATPALAESGRIFRDCPDCPDMLEIPAGSFEMGDKDTPFAKPVHRVTFAQPFAIAKTEITQGQWRAVMGNNPSKFKQCGENCPVEEVSWDDAQLFIKLLNAKTGQQYRLPSEAEWEYACRAGKRQAYCGSDKADTVSWYGPVELPYKGDAMTHPVAGKQPNEFGLYDMSGNVWEWVEDTLHQDYIGAPANGAAWLAGDKKNYRVVRGGAWTNDAEFSRAAFRHGMQNTFADSNLGFRLVRMMTLAGTSSTSNKSDSEELKKELNRYLALLPGRELERKREEAQEQREFEAANEQAEKERLKAEAKDAFRKILESAEAMCAKQEYRAYFAKTPCFVKDMKTEHLADKSKMTEEQKLVYKNAKETFAKTNAEFTKFQRTYNGSNGNKAADLYESIAQPENAKNSAALNDGSITWGQYNQRRQEIEALLRAEIKKATQP